jgi:hypothetical protein
VRYHQGVIDTTLGVRLDNIGASFGLRAEIGYSFMALPLCLAAATLAVVPDPKSSQPASGCANFKRPVGVSAPCCWGPTARVFLAAEQENQHD